MPNFNKTYMITLCLYIKALFSVEAYTINSQQSQTSRRSFLSKSTLATFGVLTSQTLTSQPQEAQAIGPIMLKLNNPVYTAKPVDNLVAVSSIYKFSLFHGIRVISM